jgi:hypothetical protein
MAQQLAIIVLVDIANALQDRTLKGNVYLFDNMKFMGSEGEGTGDLVTAVHGSYWRDGSQGTEQVLNWLPATLGSIPPTVPRNYRAVRAQESDRQALLELEALVGNAPTAGTDVVAELARIQQIVGTRIRGAHTSHIAGSHKVLDVTGQVAVGDAIDAHAYPDPVITNITGAAVDEKIIYPAEYGSPDMVSDGCYWSATIDTSRPGTYAYTMHIQLHELGERNGQQVWEPVDLVCGSKLRIGSDPKRNAFTKAGMGLLPIPPASLSQRSKKPTS